MLREPGAPPPSSRSLDSINPADAEDPLVLAIDVGSSSARALVYDRAARPVAGWEAHQPYRVSTSPDGEVTVDPDDLLSLTYECIDQVLEKVSARRIAAVSCDTFWHSLIGVDEQGFALTPVLTWADTRSSPAAVELCKTLDVAAVHQRTGATIHSSYWPAKLLWLRQTDSELFSRVSHWMSFAETLYLRLFGRLAVSISMASGTGLLDIRRCNWDQKLLELLHVSETQLSPVSDFSDPCQGPLPAFQTRWPALSRVPWYLPLGDGACSNVGSGGLDERLPVVMAGTSGAVRVMRETDDFQTPEGLWTYRVDRGRILQGGALSAGGNVFAWLADVLHVHDLDAAEKAVGAMPPDGHGLTILPFLAGERSPDWNVEARSAIHGATLNTSTLDILRAFLEAVTYRFGVVYELLKESLSKPEAIIGSGAGLVRSPVWMQIMADVLGEEITMSAVPEASSRGSALLVLEALGCVDQLAAAPAPLGKTFRPDEQKHKVYREAMKRQQQLYDALLA